tara:strand:- start:299 stop:592 length:294 start_codon:yes stop_codon:yes gene_type:complete
MAKKKINSRKTLPNIILTDEEQKQLNKLDVAYAELVRAAGQEVLRHHNTIIAINGKISQIQKEQMLIGSMLVHNHGHDPEDGSWVYDSSKAEIERRV